jgi:hypothetical protein
MVILLAIPGSRPARFDIARRYVMTQLLSAVAARERLPIDAAGSPVPAIARRNRSEKHE